MSAIASRAGRYSQWMHVRRKAKIKVMSTHRVRVMPATEMPIANATPSRPAAVGLRSGSVASCDR